MSETCIVCLGDLGESANELPHPIAQAIKAEDAADGETAQDLPPFSPRDDSNDSDLIAHLLPCGHNLHNDCLKPWVERANSCPICRQSFNEVELSLKVGGPVISTYPVDDRTQVADIDPSMLIEELDDDSDSQPCPVCGEDDNEDVLLLCDGCDVGYHTYCVSLDSVPVGHWFCESCATQRAIESVCPTGSTPRPHNTAERRTRGQRRRLRFRNEATSSNWARVWQSVWDRLNIDLDFPFDEGLTASHMRRAQRNDATQRRDFREWERRFQVAERQGGTNRFRDTASALLDLHAVRERPEPPEAESQEEIRAWNAFEKAKDMQTQPSPSKRKRKSATTSPSDVVLPTEPERRLKRPRTRRAQDLAESSSDASAKPSITRRRSAGSSSTSCRPKTPEATASTNSNGPSFLQSLLKEVEASAAPDETKGQRRPSLQLTLGPVDHSSPRFSSPGASPTTSNQPSPRALSKTPPPFPSARPVSPAPLTSKVEPIFPAPEFSPVRSPPREKSLPHHSKTDKRQSRPLNVNLNGWSPPRSLDASPVRTNLSLSAKSDVQKMVSAALKPYYKNQEVSKDQYTDINRSISRMLYEKVGDSGFLDGEAQERLEKMAGEEVAKAVQSLNSTAGI
ncbi:Zinc finger, RING/FYVE/PHD-type [Lasallia pustulata]|uniref:Zinc finger, RING/FYVE/PHD-type n=1 Tax=Lasallia pustulata TaxID=136370 RepID=A0A1W5D0J9_9LECA|nr:Zinc finger, RING/FYVE/PHD-type [Lasallia pustulata]